jgi:D-alanine-D-alanine ligase
MEGRKILIAVLMGGRTDEHEVSVESGINVARSLDRGKYDVREILIGKDGVWHVKDGDLLKRSDPLKALEGVDLVFLAMHGPYGEDGTMQGFLEILGIPYTGSGVLGSAICMDKVVSKELLRANGIRVPPYVHFDLREWDRGRRRIVGKVERILGFPSVVKPAALGSSVGVKIVEDMASFEEAVNECLARFRRVIVERYIAGTEVTCGVIGRPKGEDPIPLPPTEIIPKSSSFFDYRAKYTQGATDEITPARIGEEMTKRVQRVAVRVHRALRCGAMSRTDMIISGGEIYVLETNTIPGMTRLSLFPQEAKAAGIEFPRLLDMVIEYAISGQGDYGR